MDSVNSLATQGTSTLSTVITVVLWVLTIIATWRIYEKADQAGWKSIIPIYSDYIRFKITFRSGWFFLLMFIPVLNIVIYIMLQNKLAKAFGHGIGFTLGLIFLPTLFTLILGFNRIGTVFMRTGSSKHLPDTDVRIPGMQEDLHPGGSF